MDLGKRVGFACIAYMIDTLLIIGLSIFIALKFGPIWTIPVFIYSVIFSFFALRKINELMMAYTIEAIRKSMDSRLEAVVEELMETDTMHGLRIDPLQDALNSRN